MELKKVTIALLLFYACPITLFAKISLLCFACALLLY